jgi:hypothetical protein
MTSYNVRMRGLQELLGQTEDAIMEAQNSDRYNLNKLYARRAGLRWAIGFIKDNEACARMWLGERKIRGRDPDA